MEVKCRDLKVASVPDHQNNTSTNSPLQKRHYWPEALCVNDLILCVCRNHCLFCLCHSCHWSDNSQLKQITLLKAERWQQVKKLTVLPLQQCHTFIWCQSVVNVVADQTLQEVQKTKSCQVEKFHPECLRGIVWLLSSHLMFSFTDSLSPGFGPFCFLFSAEKRLCLSPNT